MKWLYHIFSFKGIFFGFWLGFLPLGNYEAILYRFDSDTIKIDIHECGCPCGDEVLAGKLTFKGKSYSEVYLKGKNAPNWLQEDWKTFWVKGKATGLGSTGCEVGEEIVEFQVTSWIHGGYYPLYFRIFYWIILGSVILITLFLYLLKRRAN